MKEKKGKKIKEEYIEIEEKDSARNIIMDMPGEILVYWNKHHSVLEGGASGVVDTEEGEVKLHFEFCLKENVDEVSPPGILTVEIGDMKVELKVKFAKLRILPLKGSKAEVDKTLEILRSLGPGEIVYAHKEEVGK